MKVRSVYSHIVNELRKRNISVIARSIEDIVSLELRIVFSVLEVEPQNGGPPQRGLAYFKDNRCSVID